MQPQIFMILHVKSNKLVAAALVAGFCTIVQAQAQNQEAVPKPPKMVPEMTEFW